MSDDQQVAHGATVRSQQLPLRAKLTLRSFLGLNLGGKFVPCPYWTNDPPREDTHENVLRGKGTWEEIEQATERRAAELGVDLANLSPDEIRAFMQRADVGIGIDCSAFVFWICDAITWELGQRPLAHSLVFPGGAIAQVIARNRGVSRVSSQLLLSGANSWPVDDLTQVQVGDVIGLCRDEHIMVVTGVDHDKDGLPTGLDYAHSLGVPGVRHGVQKSHIDLTNPFGYLIDQHWVDSNPDYLAVMRDRASFGCRLRRLKTLAKPSA